MPRTDGVVFTGGNASSVSETNGNKLVILENGMYVTVVKDLNAPTVAGGSAGSSRGLRILTSVDSGLTWTERTSILKYSNTDISNKYYCSMVAKGNRIYLIYTVGSSMLEMRGYDFSSMDEWVSSEDMKFYQSVVDAGQADMGSVSLAINEEGTELHASWSSRHSSTNLLYTFNVRYAKGIILDDDVIWEPVEQLTKLNTSSYPNFAMNPMITIVNNIPTIAIEQRGATLSGNSYNSGNAITILKRDTANYTANSYIDTRWRYYNIFSTTTNSYIQQTPYVLYMPPGVNPNRPKGRLWVMWAGIGTNSSYTTAFQSYTVWSDDFGVTWSPLKTLGGSLWYSTTSPVATYETSESNEIKFAFVTQEKSTSTYRNIEQQSCIGAYDMWTGFISSPTTIDNKTGSSTNMMNYHTNPQVISNSHDWGNHPAYMYFDEGAVKVKFVNYAEKYAINPKPFKGKRETFTNKDNTMTFRLTTTDTVNVPIVKINDTVIKTGKFLDGVPMNIIIPDEVWDNMPYGRYKKNTTHVSQTVKTAGLNLSNYQLASGNTATVDTTTFDEPVFLLKSTSANRNQINIWNAKVNPDIKLSAGKHYLTLGYVYFPSSLDGVANTQPIEIEMGVNNQGMYSTGGGNNYDSSKIPFDVWLPLMDALEPFSISNPATASIGASYNGYGAKFAYIKEMKVRECTLQEYNVIRSIEDNTKLANDVAKHLSKPNQKIVPQELSLQVGTRKWTYEIEKGMPTKYSIIDLLSAGKDVAETILPSVKNSLIETLPRLGGGMMDSFEWEDIITSLKRSPTKRTARGTATSANTYSSFPAMSGSSTSNPNMSFVSISTSSLTFVPSSIVVYPENIYNQYNPSFWSKDPIYSYPGFEGNQYQNGYYLSIPYIPNGTMKIAVNNASLNYVWIAYE